MADVNDITWIDEHVRHSAVEMLGILFESSRACVITFDGQGTIIGVNPQTAAFDGRARPVYAGVSLFEHPILVRLGFQPELKRVLAGDTVEITDSRWVTLFSREERFVDIVAGPVTVGGTVVGGVAYLFDATARHLAERAAEQRKRRARELEAFLVRDVASLVDAIEAGEQPDGALPEAMATLRSAIDDLMQFIRLEGYSPSIRRVPLVEVVRGLPHGEGHATVEGAAVYADPRLLRRILRNVIALRLKVGGSGWTVSRDDGRVRLTCRLSVPASRLRELLGPSESALDGDSAERSLAAARWMAEIMNATLDVTGDPAILCLDLPAADRVPAADSVSP